MRISDWSSDVCSSDLAPETAMLARCGDALADVLTGRARALDLLFAAAEPGDAGAVYAGSRYAGALNGLAVAAVERAVGERTGLRVLEIGGGTGGTTRHLLPMLAPRLTEYRFTDVSPAFLQAAERDFTGQGILCTSLLDIEQHPGGQGIDPAGVGLGGRGHFNQ